MDDACIRCMHVCLSVKIHHDMSKSVSVVICQSNLHYGLCMEAMSLLLMCTMHACMFSVKILGDMSTSVCFCLYKMSKFSVLCAEYVTMSLLLMCTCVYVFRSGFMVICPLLSVSASIL
jgi:hypothetical protein